MIQVKFMSQDARGTKNVDENITVADFMNENGMADGAGIVSLNSGSLNASEVNRTFAELGCNNGDTVFLAKVVNAKGA